MRALLNNHWLSGASCVEQAFGTQARPEEHIATKPGLYFRQHGGTLPERMRIDGTVPPVLREIDAETTVRRLRVLVARG